MQNTEVENNTEEPTTPTATQRGSREATSANPGKPNEDVRPTGTAGQAAHAEREGRASSVSKRVETHGAKGRQTNKKPDRTGAPMAGAIDGVLTKASGSVQTFARRFRETVGGLSENASKKTASPKRADARRPAKPTDRTARRPAPNIPSSAAAVKVAVGSGGRSSGPSAEAARRKKGEPTRQIVLRKMSNTDEVARAIRILGIIARAMCAIAKKLCIIVLNVCIAIKNLLVLMVKNLPRAIDWAKNNVRLLKYIAIGLFVCAYVACSLVFSHLFLPGTTINGRDVSLKSADAVAAEVQEVAKGYMLTVSGDGLDFEMQGADIDLAVDTDAYRNDASAYLRGWTWPITMLFPHEHQISTAVAYSKEKLQSAVREAVDDVNEDAIAPQDAAIAYDDSKNSFVAKAEKAGTVVSCDSVIEAVEQRISALQEQAILGSDELVQPDLVASGQKMEQAIQEANKVGGLDIVLTVDNKEFETLDKGLIRSWVVLNKDYSIKGDSEAVTAWARQDLSMKIDTINTTRTYTRPNDKKRIEVFGGTYGWNVDSAKLAKTICKRMEEASGDPIEIPMQSRGAVLALGTQDWGPRYVDVDLSEQYVRMFDENSNVVMESECVSGNMSLGTDTVTGVFTLEDKQSPMLLVGLDDDGDGKPDYENEVQYWMPFYGGYGLHDALWRGSFGGEAYQYDGSHGCVNLPYSAAEILYGYVKVGDVVVVHQ